MYIGRVEPYIDGVTTWEGGQVISLQGHQGRWCKYLLNFTVYQCWKQFCKPGALSMSGNNSTPASLSGIWVRTCDTELVRFRELDLRRHDTD